jgi:hypothetical protein
MEEAMEAEKVEEEEEALVVAVVAVVAMEAATVVDGGGDGRGDGGGDGGGREERRRRRWRRWRRRWPRWPRWRSDGGDGGEASQLYEAGAASDHMVQTPEEPWPQMRELGGRAESGTFLTMLKGAAAGCREFDDAKILIHGLVPSGTCTQTFTYDITLPLPLLGQSPSAPMARVDRYGIVLDPRKRPAPGFAVSGDGGVDP